MGGDDDEDRQDGMEPDDLQLGSGFADLNPEVTTFEVDLFLTLNAGESGSWNPQEVFACALNGLFEAMLPTVCLVEAQIHSDGDLDFARDVECRAPSIDRHGSYLAQKKAKERVSNAIGRTTRRSIYGNSRSPSRASSRAQSRVSAALTTSVMAMKMAKLAFGKPPASTQGDAPFRINEWNDSDSTLGKLRGATHDLDPYAAMSSRFSLASSRVTARTSRIPVDHQEMRRREEISRDIDTREGREKLTARIQRKGELKLKLRSMVDPTMSFDREEYEAQKKNRAGLMSRGKSGTTSTTAIARAEPAGIARGQSVISNGLIGTATSRSIETTYRPEDYEGLHSDLVIFDKKGELLVGDNCYLVARKPRSELQHDLLQKNTIKPRVHFPHALEPESNEDEPSDGQKQACEAKSKTTSRYSPHRLASRQSPVRSNDVAAPSPTFEGQSGTFQQYPKIELDPKKTPLTKGVTIKPPAPPALSLVPAPGLLKEMTNRPSHGKVKQKITPFGGAKSVLTEDRTNDPVESAMKNAIQSTGKPTKRVVQPVASHPVSDSEAPGGHTPARSTARTTRVDSSASSEYVLPIKSHVGEKQHLQSLRLRTPAYGNKNGRVGSMVLGISHGETVEDDVFPLHHAVDQMASLSTPNKGSSEANLPKFSSYVREFPLPPPGQIHVVSSPAAATLVSPTTTKSAFPFSSLPSVIRGKR